MKKFLISMMAATMAFTFVSCAQDTGGNNNDDNDKDINDVVEDKLDEAKDFEMFSVEAAEYYLEEATGIKLSEIEPDWEWIFASDYAALGESDRALASFTKKDGELSQDDINAYYKKVFDRTAAASDDGYNIIGYEFVSEGEDALSEVNFEDAIAGWIPGWAFRKDGVIYVVYVNSGYDNSKESTIGSVLYYNSVKTEITKGMQKSWDDYMDYIEDNADEIEDALNDYLN